MQKLQYGPLTVHMLLWIPLKQQRRYKNAQSMTWLINKNLLEMSLLSALQRLKATRQSLMTFKLNLRLCWPGVCSPLWRCPPPPWLAGAPDSVLGKSPVPRSPAGRAHSGTASAASSRAIYRCPSRLCTRSTVSSSRTTGGAPRAPLAATAEKKPQHRRGTGTLSPPSPLLQAHLCIFRDQ